MKIKTTAFFVILYLLLQTTAMAQIVELPLSERIKNSTYIIEGKVVSQSCFWDKQHANIYTSNRIEIYKILKGKYTTSEIEIITEGGQIGDDMQAASESLELRIGDIGTFFTELTSVQKMDSTQSGGLLYRTYGGPQGFIRYDLTSKSGNDSFKTYNNVKDELYNPIITASGQPLIELKPFTISAEPVAPTKKRCCLGRLCKKKTIKQ